ncbi:hypothetical protein NP233_g3287 [Leucocoprinus birnbaumii]|uniref:Ricin B lectin domain-containing protein n=1 Tax=Leucocoprinus birnbaumii TaxID=56174 RepID=A0AAD5VZF7_9AGAR|nr:hypothetical protein NP233_g3287 [Leucocoprinus birnbaumii]
MFAKLPLLVLVLSALASAESVTICNDPTGYCFTLDTVIAQPYNPVVFLPPDFSYGQRWFFNSDGAIFNLYAGYVLEAPIDSSGEIVAGRPLYMALQSGETNQQWKIDDQGRIVSLRNESMAIWGVHKTINRAYDQLCVYPANDDPTQKWNVSLFFPQQFGQCPDFQGNGCRRQFDGVNAQTVLSM